MSETCMMLQGTARQVYSVATHPSQPDKCASGGSNGTVAVWDLRFAAAPMVAHTGKQNAGDVWQVCCHSLLVGDCIADATAIVELASISVHSSPSTSCESPTPARILQYVLSQLNASCLCRFNLMQITNQEQPKHLQFCSALMMETCAE